MKPVRFPTLTDDELGSVTQQQETQQDLWRNASRTGSVVNCCGQDFEVHAKVFPPRSDTRSLVENMTVAPGAAVLDMGTGSGVLAVFAAMKGAGAVVAVDINPDAVRNASSNAERHGFADRIEVRLSDGFSAIGVNEGFDLIIANLPGRNETAPDLVAAAQWDTDFRTHKAFFSAAPDHLAPAGIILMAKANYPELNDVIELAEQSGFSISVLAKKSMSNGDPRVYYTFALSRS